MKDQLPRDAWVQDQRGPHALAPEEAAQPVDDAEARVANPQLVGGDRDAREQAVEVPPEQASDVDVTPDDRSRSPAASAPIVR